METKQVKCIVCEKEYPRRIKSRRGRSSVNERGKNTITCSPKCANIYRRVYLRVREKVKQK